MKRINEMLEQKNTSVGASTEKSRRSFLKKAAIGTPIVIASSAKPAWGAACMSGMMSGNVSNHEHVCELSGGLSHGYWRNHYVGKNQNGAPNNEPLLESDQSNAGQYFIKGSGGVFNYSNSNPKLHVNSMIGDYNFQQWLVINGNYVFEREIITAFLNASFPYLNYPYTTGDVWDIYVAVTETGSTLDRTEVAKMLEGIHILGEL